MLKLKIFDEPLLEFRYGQKLYDPHDGLVLFGPSSADASSHPKSITYGVIGTKEGLALFADWSKRINKPVYSEIENPILWPMFPGFKEAFDSQWPEKPALTHEVDRDKIIRASKNADPNKRAFDVVEEYLNGISLKEKHDESFHVFICIIPDEVWKNCRPNSSVADAWGEHTSKKTRKIRMNQRSLFNEWSVDEYKFSVDFRRQIKARAMKYDVPIQIIKESTLSTNPPEHGKKTGKTPSSDRAWNLSTTLYYKAGGRPWKLATAREGVCYIGISFRRTDIKKDKRTACCAAQMFLDSGEGVVFLGDEGPWYSEDKKEFKLDRDAANRLLNGILKTYNQLEGKKLTEIFIHSRSYINPEQFQGYQDACPSGVKLVGIRVRLNIDTKLFRKGKYPVIRGTFLQTNDKSAYLWATGFKLRLQTYDGWEVPVPLKIDIEYGQASIEQVSKDILSLTKLNYNACRFADSQPVTIGFSDSIGEILISNPTITDRKPNFKFYI